MLLSTSLTLTLLLLWDPLRLHRQVFATISSMNWLVSLFFPRLARRWTLQRATVESACFDSPASPPSPGQGHSSSASNVGLLGTFKLKVGLIIRKDSKVTVSNAGACTNESNISSNDNVSDGNIHSNTGKLCSNNGKSNSDMAIY